MPVLKTLRHSLSCAGAMAADHCPICNLAKRLVHDTRTGSPPWSKENIRRTMCLVHPDRRCHCGGPCIDEAFAICLDAWRTLRRPPSNPEPAAVTRAPPPPPPAPSSDSVPLPVYMYVCRLQSPLPGLPMGRFQCAPPGLPMGNYSLSQYERQFGEISEQFPYGRLCWEGLVNLFRPYITAKGWRMAQLPKHFAYFIVPYNFSKRNAEMPRSDSNPGGALGYPCIFTRDPFYPDLWLVACVKILMDGSQPWRVHPSHCVTVEGFDGYWSLTVD